MKNVKIQKNFVLKNEKCKFNLEVTIKELCGKVGNENKKLEKLKEKKRRISKLMQDIIFKIGGFKM